MRPPSRIAGRGRLAGVACALVLIGSGCSGEASTPPATPDVAAPFSDETQTQLEALGYAKFVGGEQAGDLSITGVTHHDPARVSAGLNLFKRRFAEQAVLMTLDGEIVHRWRRPPLDVSQPRWHESVGEATRVFLQGRERNKAWHWFEPLPNGDLVAVSSHSWVERIRWDSTPVWRTPVPAHHDVEIDEEQGRVLTLTKNVQRVTHRDGTSFSIVSTDIVVLDLEDGRVLDTIPLAPLFGHLLDKPRQKKIDRGLPIDVFHTNSIELLRRDWPGLGRAGQVLISVRNLDRVAVVDLEERRTVWSWGADDLDDQHHPSILPNGNLLIFDNRKEDEGSRVVELDPRRKEVVWEYRGDTPDAFFSRLRGSAYQLPNGNVLIAESDRGHAIEVTRSGETVWEYWAETQKKRATIYRFARIPAGFFQAGLLDDSVARRTAQR